MSLSGGSFPAKITPMPQKVVVQDNFIDFNNLANGQWAQQYLPELYEQEVERYGNRTLSGFLRMVGAEMPMTSDQVIWSEQNRLHIAYDNCTLPGGEVIVVAPVAGSKSTTVSFIDITFTTLPAATGIVTID